MRTASDPTRPSRAATAQRLVAALLVRMGVVIALSQAEKAEAITIGDVTGATTSAPISTAAVTLSPGGGTTTTKDLAVPRAIGTDFDGDGKADLVVFRPGSGTWFQLKSSSGFTKNTATQFGLNGDVPVPGDYDGDEKADVAVYRPSTGTWYVLPSGAGTAASTQYGLSTDVPVPGDYDGDGKSDLAVFRASAGVWYIRQSSTNTTVTVALGLSTDIPVPADYDGDGTTDVAVYRPSHGMWHIRRSGTNDTTSESVQWGLPGDVPVAGNYDGDGEVDLAVWRPSTAVWYIRQSSTSSITFVSSQWGLPGDSAVPADYDGDGKIDLAVYRPTTGTWYVRQSTTDYLISVTFQWGLPGDVPVPNGPIATAIAAARGKATVSALANLVRSSDVDGDGKADLTVYRPSTLVWWTRQSSSAYTTSATFPLGVSGDLPVSGDFDGDGKTDLGIFRPSVGLWLFQSTTTGFTTPTPVQWGLPGDTPVPNDYDGDGRTDFAVYRPSTGTWYLLQSSANFTTSAAYQWGLPNDIPVPGDYDGDGLTDLAVHRPSTGVWHILQSSTAYTTFVSHQWGLSGDIPVPGDFDGDGKTDLAVHRPTTGVWYLLKSSANFATFVAYQWGLSGDIPVAGEFDGDGKTDLAVYRPTTGVWFILNSSANYTTAVSYQWGLSGDIPVLKATAVAVSVSPASASIQVGATQQFTATVTRTSNPSVTWSVAGVRGGNATVGTISTTGLYTAAAAVPSTNPVTVTATSVADTITSASAAVTITAVAVSVSPTSATVHAAGTIPFIAGVSGTTNTAVAWSVNGVVGGSATVGTISTTGIYRAPTAVPNPNAVTVVATSTHRPSESASASVTIAPSTGNAIALSASNPASAAPFGLLTINGSGFDSTAQLQVTFFNTSGFSVRVPVLLATSIAVVTSVPPFFSENGTPASGIVNIQVAQLSSSGTTTYSNVLSGFQIQELTAGPTLPPGTLTLAFLQATLQSTTNLQSNFGSALPSDLKAALPSQITSLQNLIAQAQAVMNGPTSSVTIGQFNGGNITVGPSDLAVADRFLLTILTAFAGPTPDLATFSGSSFLGSHQPASPWIQSSHAAGQPSAVQTAAQAALAAATNSLTPPTELTQALTNFTTSFIHENPKTAVTYSVVMVGVVGAVFAVAIMGPPAAVLSGGFALAAAAATLTAPVTTAEVIFVAVATVAGYCAQGISAISSLEDLLHGSLATVFPDKLGWYLDRFSLGYSVLIAIKNGGCKPLVNPPSGIGSFTASPTTIAAGASSTLSWSGITDATNCSINNGVGTVLCSNASTSVSPSTTTTYTLTATGAGGSATATTTVTVNAATNTYHGTYSAPFDGTFSDPYGDIYAASANFTFSLTLTRNGDGSISGMANVPVQVDITVVSCPNGFCSTIPSSPVVTGSVTGTSSHISGSLSSGGTSPFAIALTGVISGNSITVTGTFTRTFRGTSGGEAPIYTTLTGTITGLTLAKQ